MSERIGSTGSGPDKERDTREKPDVDISFRWVYVVAAALVIVTLFYGLLSWPLSVGFFRAIARQDPPPSPIPEAHERALPPAPRLQPAPPVELEALRAREDAILKSHGWVDREAGRVRIPVARARELILEEGLPQVPNPAPATGGTR